MTSFKKSIAVALSFVTIFSCIWLPAAADVDYKQRITLSSWLGSFLNDVIGYSFGMACPESADGYHHSRSFDHKDWLLPTYYCVCDYCGARYEAYELDVQQSYDAYVDDLPVTGIDSEGHLVWYPKFKYAEFFYTGSLKYYVGDVPAGSKTPDPSICYVTMVDHLVNFNIRAESLYCNALQFHYSDTFPVDGFYSIDPLSKVLSCVVIKSSGSSEHLYDSASVTSFSSSSLRKAGDSQDFYSYFSQVNFGYVSYLSAFTTFRLIVTPLEGLIDPVGDTTYNIDTRVGSLTGNLGIIAGNNNTLTQIQNNYIFNETNNTFYSPTYNTYSPVTNWYYDYTTRTYQLTLDGGLTVEVTYGDEYITVKEGDTVYNVYYIINDDGGGSGEDPDPTPTPGPGGEDPDGPDDPGPGGDEDRAGIIGWLEKIYNKLCDILAAIFGLDLKPDIDVDVNVSIDGEDADQQNWFMKLVSKFNWVSQLSKIFKQLVADVGSDAGSAAAISDGIITVDMLSSGHAVPIDGGVQVYTAPELNITMGSSNAYGVDWGNIKVIDLSWYAEYKETVDRIISGFLWLGYIYLLIKRAPEIVSGSGMVSERISQSDKGG